MVAGLLLSNINYVLKRLIKQLLSSQPSTPPSNKPTLLFLPLHLKTPKSHLGRARYAYTILYPKIIPKVAKLVVKKLIEHL